MVFFDWVGNAIFGVLISKLQHLLTKVAKLTMSSTTDPNVPFRQDVVDLSSYLSEGAEEMKRTEIDQTIRGHSPITPEQAAADFPGLFAGALGIVQAYDIANLITEVASVGQIDKAIESMKKTILLSTGAQKILGVIANLEIECGSQIPLKYHFQKKHLPMIPPMGDCVEALSRYIILPGEFDKLSFYHGFHSQYGSWYKEFANTPLKYFALAAVARSGLYDEDFFDIELKRAGYAKESIVKLKGMYMALAAETELAGAKSIATKAFRDGIIDQSKLEDYLLSSGLDPTLIGLTIDMELLRKETEDRDVSASVHSKLFRLGVINETEYRTRLKTLGYSDQAIDDYVAIELLKKDEEPKILSLSQLNDGYKYNLIDDNYYYQHTKNLGYSPEYSQLLLDTLKAKMTRAPQDEHRDLNYTQAMKLFKQGTLSMEEIKTRLSLMGYTSGDVDLLISMELYEMNTPESDVIKPLPRSTVMDLYQHDVINYSDYIDRMDKLRYTRSDADLLIVLEQAKIKQPEIEVPKPLPRATVMDLYMATMISFDDYIDRMELLGYDEENAVLFIALEISKEMET